MKRIIKVLVIAAVVIASVVADWSFVTESMKMADTCLLWMHGNVAGWAQIVFYCLLMDLFICVPAWMIWDDIDNI